MDDGQSWTYDAQNYATTRIIGGLDDTANYMASVRTRNSRGEGPWTNSGNIGLTVGNLAQTAHSADEIATVTFTTPSS